MRTYLIDNNKNEIIVDLIKSKVHKYNLVEFHYSTIENNKIINEANIFIRKVAGQYFLSQDKKTWKKTPRQDLPSRMININIVYNIFRGFRPSGSSNDDTGELLTKMPGKIIKVFIKELEKIKKGQTLIILEAMKMENEIKAGMDGIVKKIHIKEGDILEENVLMVEVGLD